MLSAVIPLGDDKDSDTQTHKKEKQPEVHTERTWAYLLRKHVQ